jgi:hypothetical protein
MFSHKPDLRALTHLVTNRARRAGFIATAPESP